MAVIETDVLRDDVHNRVKESQVWVYAKDGKVEHYHLAHVANGLAGIPGADVAHEAAREANKFFFRHILLRSKKNTTPENKAMVRQARRENHAAAGADLRTGGLTMQPKFGDAHGVEKDNHVIDLSVISKGEALADIRKSIVNFNGWKANGHGTISLQFRGACVKSTDDFKNGKFTMRVSVVKINDTNYTIYHCDGF